MDSQRFLLIIKVRCISKQKVRWILQIILFVAFYTANRSNLLPLPFCHVFKRHQKIKCFYNLVSRSLEDFLRWQILLKSLKFTINAKLFLCFFLHLSGNALRLWALIPSIRGRRKTETECGTIADLDRWTSRSFPTHLLRKKHAVANKMGLHQTKNVSDR